MIIMVAAKNNTRAMCFFSSSHESVSPRDLIRGRLARVSQNEKLDRHNRHFFGRKLTNHSKPSCHPTLAMVFNFGLDSPILSPVPCKSENSIIVASETAENDREHLVAEKKDSSVAAMIEAASEDAIIKPVVFSPLESSHTDANVSSLIVPTIDHQDKNVGSAGAVLESVPVVASGEVVVPILADPGPSVMHDPFLECLIPKEHDDEHNTFLDMEVLMHGCNRAL
jgi:hypothetical protein